MENIKFLNDIVEFGDTASIGAFDIKVRVYATVGTNKTLSFQFKAEPRFASDQDEILFSSISWQTTEEPVGTVTRVYYDDQFVVDSFMGEYFYELVIQPTDINEFLEIYKENTELFVIESKEEGIRLGETLITEDDAKKIPELSTDVETLKQDVEELKNSGGGGSSPVACSFDVTEDGVLFMNYFDPGVLLVSEDDHALNTVNNITITAEEE